MVTDNARREVARKLRELEIGVIGTVIPTGELIKNILNTIDYGHSNAMTPYGLLADLIEPSCDRDKLLELANDMVGMFRIGAVSGEGLDTKWCRELHNKYASCIRDIIDKE